MPDSRALTLPDSDPTASLGQEEALRGIMDEASNLYSDAVDAARGLSPEWCENLAFYLSHQHGYQTPHGYFQPNAPDEAAETVDFTSPTVLTAAASFVRGMPNPECVPSNDGMETLAKADVSQSIVRGFLRSETFPGEENFRTRIGAEVFGLVRMKTVWDPSRGGVVTDPMTGERRREGNVIIRGYPPDQAIGDPTARSQDAERYVCHRKIAPISSLESTFRVDIFGEPTRGKFASGSAAFALGLRSASEMREHIATGGDTRTGRAKGNDVGELVEFWWRPDDTWLDGLLVVFSGRTLIHVGQFPDGLWPWDCRFGDHMDPFSLYPLGLVHSIKDIQRTMNRGATKRREWLDKALSPGVLEPEGANLVGEMDDIVGWRMRYTAPWKPEWMQVPPMPDSFFGLEQASINHIQTITGYSDISRGAPPPNMNSGRMMAFTLEAQAGAHEPLIKIDHDCIASCLTKALRIAGRRYDEGRMVRIVGENKRPMLKAITRDDVDWNADVLIEPYSGKPNSRALRVAEGLELFQAGAFDDERPGAKALRENLDMDYEDRATHQWKDAHLSRARAEQLALKQDPLAQIPVVPADDDEIHIPEHTRWAVTPEFFALDPVAQQTHLEHLAQHEQQRSQKLGVFTEEANMLSGGTAAPDGGPPPPKQPGIESPLDGGHDPYDGAAEMQPDDLNDGTGRPPGSRTEA